MAMQARRVQIIVACNLIARLTRSKPSVNFSALGMLTCAAFSGQGTQPSFNQPWSETIWCPGLLFGYVCAEGEMPMKSKLESPTAQELDAPSETPTLHCPVRQGVEVSALMRAEP